MLFPGKTAMSPLIATVLLIAFAVALGAMIMNWSAGIDPEDTLGVDCMSVAIQLERALCANGNSLELDVRNTGEERIDGIELILRNEAEELDLSLRVKDTSMIPRERIQRSVNALIPNLDTIAEVNPMILNEDGELIACPSKGLLQDKLVSC